MKSHAIVIACAIIGMFVIIGLASIYNEHVRQEEAYKAQYIPIPVATPTPIEPTSPVSAPVVDNKPAEVVSEGRIQSVNDLRVGVTYSEVLEALKADYLTQTGFNDVIATETLIRVVTKTQPNTIWEYRFKKQKLTSRCLVKALLQTEWVDLRQ